MAIVDFEKKGHLAIIRLNRPDKKNALNLELMEHLRDCWNAFLADEVLGKNPSKVNRVTGKPDTDNAAINAQAPGTGDTGRAD